MGQSKGHSDLDLDIYIVNPQVQLDVCAKFVEISSKHY